MADDDLVPSGGDEPRAGGLVCEFCECSLTKAGEVKRLSAKAKKIRRLEEEAERATGRVGELQAEVATLREELDRVKAAGPVPAGSVTGGSRRDYLA